MTKFGCLGKFINTVCQFHDGMIDQALDYGQCFSAFQVTSGVKQGCVLAPILFSMMFSIMLSENFSEDKSGIQVSYHTAGKLFHLKRLQDKTKVEGALWYNFLFADDCALNASSEAEMQQSMNQFSVTCDKFGLIFNTKKTEVLHQSALHYLYMKPLVKANEEMLNAVEVYFPGIST